MRFRDVFWAAFVFLMVVAFFIAGMVGVSSLKEDRDAQILEIEQAEIAHEKCLIAGYPEFVVVNSNFYCIARQPDGEVRIKVIIAE